MDENVVSFNLPAVTGKELEYIQLAINENKLSGDGLFTSKCSNWFEYYLGTKKVLLTTSCTHALEMAAMLADIKEGDEVIMPSYTFVSTANAFVLRGARIKYIDIDPHTMNIDVNLIEAAVTKKTKAIVPVHYAGISCNMDVIMRIADKYKLVVIEDAAQAVMCKYQGKYLGTIGHLGCYSFHETKNYQCGEGGCLVINDPKYIERAEVLREKGTDRSKFFRGQVDKYSWVDLGSSYLPSELNAAFLYAQLEHSNEILRDRVSSWNIYYEQLDILARKGYITLPQVPKDVEHNGHLFYIKVKNLEERSKLISYLHGKGIYALFHYVPLHSSTAGMKYGEFVGVDKYTTSDSDRLLRLPLYYKLEQVKIKKVINEIYSFFDQSRFY